jgi:alpha-glucosidase
MELSLKIKVILSLLCLHFLVPLQSVCQTSTPSNDLVLISSPDGAIRLLIQTHNGRTAYSISFNKIPVIEPSAVGLVVNGKVWREGTSTGKVQRYKINETYPYRGVHSTAVNKCNGAKINIASTEVAFILEARVFNDGVAFRYLINNTDSAIVEKDTTGFVLPSGSMVWSQSNVKYYEGRYGRKKIEECKKDELAGPPLTIELPSNKGFAVITEGGLTDFAGMSLRADGNRGFHANLSGVAKKNGNIETPWRIIEIGKDLNALVNCDIIANVSPPFDPKLFPKGYNSDWIKPGRSVWSWLAATRSVTLENMKHFSDLAAQLGFEYNLVDEGWSNWKDSVGKRDQWDMMKELVDYSAKKGVKIWVWKAYPDRGGIPGIKEPEKRREFLKRCKDLGIAGLKVDFFDSESQKIINFYQDALRDAAAYQLMLNFHGANKPTGESRTWPNEMTREAIRGMENRPPWAEGNTTLPFTRYLAGHADYTPIHFGDRQGEVSWAHHVASMVVFTSPFLCLGADPQSILDNPSKEIIQSIPSVWDETIVLPQSRIGDLVLYARRKGDTWFLAAMNGVNTPKTVTVQLSFLKKGSYQLSLLKDDESKQGNVLPEKKTAVSPKSSITINLNGAGGFVGRFEK